MPKDILIPIITASAVLAGVMISQAFSLLLSFLDRRHKKQELYRQKYEELMFHFSNSLLWLAKVLCSKTYDQLSNNMNDADSRKALNLCLLYFPDLAKCANEYILAQSSLVRALSSTYDIDSVINFGQQLIIKDEDKYNITMENYKTKRYEFEILLIVTASKYTMPPGLLPTLYSYVKQRMNLSCKK